jgi:hypothetical protein
MCDFHARHGSREQAMADFKARRLGDDFQP